jgi:tetratricopeptide (TPR) repeat protein
MAPLMMPTLRSLTLMLLLATFGIACAAPRPAAKVAPKPVEQAVTVHFPVSCDESVQADFDRAVTLLHHMTYPQARAAFQEIAERDSGCAMAQWGIAMTLFTPLWPTRPSAADLQQGWDAVQKGRALAPPTAREREFVGAAAAFFQDPDSTDYWARIARWETAMAAMHTAFPGDTEVSAFYALALLASARPGPSAQEHSRHAVELLEPVLRDNPSHPGAMHYMIHANDLPGREHNDLDIVQGYEKVAPDNPHALHMPTHIYTRLGDWDGVIRGNLRAEAAALKYPAGDQAQYVTDEFPHAIEYLVYAYLQQAEDQKAAAQIKRLYATVHLEPTVKTAFHLASTRARYALERHAWAEAAALEPRSPTTVAWEQYPWPEAVTWFARGYGAVRRGKDVEARSALGPLQELEGRATQAGEEIFARQIQILRLDLAAWAAHAMHDDDSAIATLQQAVELEASTPKPAVTPAPTIPAAELLADLLTELKRPREALAAYQLSLQRFPKRFNSTAGAARSFAATDDAANAEKMYCQLLQLAEHGSRAEIAEARRFVEARKHRCAPGRP